MADPVTLGLMAVGTAVNAFGAAQTGAGTAAMQRYQAGVAQINAQIAEQNAQYAIAAGETDAQRSAMHSRAIIASTKAIQGASNLDVNRGSAVDVRASEAEIGAEDQAMVRANAARQAYGYETQKTGFLAESMLDTMAARNTQTATGFKVAGSLIGGATSVSDKWYRMGAAGVSPSLMV